MSYLEKLKQIEQLFRQSFLIVDEGIVKLLFATIIANRFDNDPVWLFIIAPSGGGKTEFITSLNKVIDVYPISTVTSKTFISGKRPRAGEETSLLFSIGQSGILTFKDFTSMLSLPHEERNAIMGQLREIYDGSMVRAYGTGEKIEWRGKLGLVAGVTSVIHVARELYAAMGERFIMYSIVLPERKQIAARALDNTDTVHAKREILRDEVQKFLDDMDKKNNAMGGIGIPKEKPKIDPDIKEDILDLAELSTRARSPVDREWRSPNKDIIYVHPPEVPTRFVMQLASLASAFKVINQGQLLPEDKKILFKIALDSITDTRRKALQELGRYEEVETAGLAVKIDYPTNTVRRWLEDLNALKVIDRVKTAGKADRWKLKPHYRDLIKRFEGIEVIGTELTEDTAESQPSEEQMLTDALQARDQLEQPSPSEPSEQTLGLSSDDTSEEQSPAAAPDSSPPIV